MNAALLVALVVTALFLIAAGALSFIPTHSTPIDLIVAAQSASLQTADEEVVLTPFLADEITVVGNGRVEGIPGLNSFTSAVTIVTSERSMPLTLQSVRMARGTTVTLRRYPGMGYDASHFTRDGFGFSLGIDIGVILGGDPNVTITTDKTVPGLAEETETLKGDYKNWFNYHPVLMVSGKFSF